jgi:diguanylate cyclase (GGDEF)-like protein/PAS domain S-box-containing protein
VHPVLIIEKSAPLLQILRRQLKAHGFIVVVAHTYDDALQLLRNRSASHQYTAAIFGYPVSPDRHAAKVLALLCRPKYLNLPVIVMTPDSDTDLFGWIERRANSASLPWNDCTHCAECLAKLLLASSQAELAENRPQKIRILLVDDSRTARTSYKRLMCRYGYDVDIAATAGKAMEMAKQNPYDIAIVDYYMPEENGDVLCRRLRKHPLTKNITVAIITDAYEKKVIRASLEAGAVECMFKNEAPTLFTARLVAITRSIRTHRTMEAEHERLMGILRSVGDGVYGVNRDGEITFINPGACNILGYSDDHQLIGRSAHKLFHYAHEDKTPNSRKSCRLQQAYRDGNEIHNWSTVFWHRAGMPIPVECTAYPLEIEGQFEGTVVAFRDITERRILERELLWQASHDSLTKLCNRGVLEKHLENEVNRLKRSTETSAMLYLDLDRFKHVNDTVGHAAGDRLLIEISQQLQTRIRDSDLLARLGGDEFAILMRNIDKNHIHATADGLREILETYTFIHAGRKFKVNGSIGVALFDQHTLSPGDVLANADVACRVAKGKGRNQTHLYNAEHDERIAMDLEIGWSGRLQDALRDGNFILHYQPILAMTDIDAENANAPSGELWNRISKTLPQSSWQYEVLVRLMNPRGDIVYPGTFLPTAERFGLMHQIDTWVLTHAVKKLSALNQQGAGATFTINISGHSLDADHMVPLLRDLLNKHKFEASSLVFEISEANAIANIDAAKKLIGELREFGCRFALDDFGSGFSSFFHLKHLPVDYVKIDGQFVQGMKNCPADRAIVSSINEIAHSYGKRTVAEFVENADVLRVLQESGVDFVQGHHISRPSSNLPEFNLFRSTTAAQA